MLELTKTLRLIRQHSGDLTIVVIDEVIPWATPPQHSMDLMEQRKGGIGLESQQAEIGEILQGRSKAIASTLLIIRY